MFLFHNMDKSILSDEDQSRRMEIALHNKNTVAAVEEIIGTLSCWIEIIETETNFYLSFALKSGRCLLVKW